MTEDEALKNLKDICREFLSSDGDNDTLIRLVEAADRYWTAGAEWADAEPVDLDVHTRRAVIEAVEWDRAFRPPPPNTGADK